MRLSRGSRLRDKVEIKWGDDAPVALRTRFFSSIYEAKGIDVHILLGH